MTKVMVIYQSKYGTTLKYAKWIAEELSCDLIERKKVRVNQLEAYDTIIYGGGLYAGGVSGIDLLTKNFNKLSDKNIILFTCGLASTEDEDNVKHIREGLKKVLTEEMEKNIKVFHLRGGIDYTKLGILHKAMMAMLHKMMLKKDYNSLRAEDKEMLDTYGGIVDFTNKATIEPIIKYVKSLQDKRSY